ncbi:MAG: hypothetical protein LBK98_06765 [Peptococcaceae bacterium]|nr:hypothetical protein [Peptococcaceae bacterium]
MPLLFFAVVFLGSAINPGNDDIPAEEQIYIDTVLARVTAETTKEEAIELLGKPSRDLVLKVNWWVVIANRNSRVGIYFSGTTGKAEEVVLDGGWGKFYYTKTLGEKEK